MASSALSRRRFTAAGAAAFTSVAVVRAPAKAAEFSYKVGTDNAINHPLNVRMIQMWDEVRRQTNGRLDVKVFPNNELGGATAMLTQLRSGALEFLAQAGGQLSSVVPVGAIEGVGFAFKDSKSAWAAMDGDLGQYVRNALIAGGIYAFPMVWENGMREVTNSVKPIASANDLDGLKIRTPPGALWVDLFKSLGASPTAMNFNEVYTSLQTKVIDGQENPYAVIELSRLYEVQKYLSVTNHMWSGFWLVANMDKWNALPKDVQAIVTRAAAKYTPLQRNDTALLNASLLDKLGRRGLTVNRPDTAPFKAKLNDFYKKWKVTFGPQAWALLEKYSGPLGSGTG